MVISSLDAISIVIGSGTGTSNCVCTMSIGIAILNSIVGPSNPVMSSGITDGMSLLSLLMSG